MPLSAGTRIGEYEITSAIGAGGMGEIYRARDTQLDRDVAIKILPELFAADPERLARFEREAKTLASLNHPHIAQIYGLAPLDAVTAGRALVMELVEGEDLSVRIARGPIAVADALAIARQIADALEGAHERGIIHRDLKPANIKVRNDGTVKVLDFGLAKALDPAAGSNPNVMNSPTITSPATQLGVILGTAAYMAPEQAKGRVIDRRADVWAFGVVLFEMLTAKRAFEGGDISEVLASVLKDAPALASLPADTPNAIHRLLRRCLEKNPAKRLDSMAAARLDIEEALNEPANGVGAQSSTSAAPIWRRAVPWVVAAVAVAIAAAASVTAWRKPPAPAVRMSIALPDGHVVTSGPVITRDGRLIAFASGTGGAQKAKLYTRTLDSFELRELPGTEDAHRPFFSPNGRWIAFFARSQLFKLDLDGGAAVPIAEAPSPGGGTWSEDGTIVFVPTWNGGLYRVEADGTVKPIIQPDPAKKEYAYTSPTFLPGGKELLFSVWGSTFSISRLTFPDLQRDVVAPGSWTAAVHAASGHLLVGNNQGDVQAHTYPRSSREQPPVSVLSKVHWSGGSGDGAASYAVSEAGTLVYAPADITQRSFVIVDETGRAEAVPSEPQPYLWVALSPDGRRAAADQDGQIWMVDLERGGRTPLAPQRGGAQTGATWSADGTRLYFASNTAGNWEIYRASATGSGAVEQVLKREFDQFPASLAPDGTLIFAELRPGAGSDLWLLPPDGKPVAWMATQAKEENAVFSPDGGLIAYASNASGRAEIYVQARTAGSRAVQVSTNGGNEPEWAPAGDRIYYREGNALVTADIKVRPVLSAGKPQRLFDRGWELPSNVGWGIMPDGKRFLMIRFAPSAIPMRVDVAFNWFEELRKRVR